MIDSDTRYRVIRTKNLFPVSFALALSLVVLNTVVPVCQAEDSSIPTYHLALGPQEIEEVEELLSPLLKGFLWGTPLQPVKYGGKIIGCRIALHGHEEALIKIGLAPGDIVKTVNGKRVRGLHSVLRIIASLRNSGWVDIALEREGQEQNVSVTLEP